MQPYFAARIVVGYATVMLLVATIGPTHSTCRVGFILRNTGLKLTENCWSLRIRMASGQIPSRWLIV